MTSLGPSSIHHNQNEDYLERTHNSIVNILISFFGLIRNKNVNGWSDPDPSWVSDYVEKGSIIAISL